jgi:hypothetical protein
MGECIHSHAGSTSSAVPKHVTSPSAAKSPNPASA